MTQEEIDAKYKRVPRLCFISKSGKNMVRSFSVYLWARDHNAGENTREYRLMLQLEKRLMRNLGYSPSLFTICADYLTVSPFCKVTYNALVKKYN